MMKVGKQKLKSKPSKTKLSVVSQSKVRKTNPKKILKSVKQKQKVKQKSKADLGLMSIDDFMSKGFDSSDDSSNEQDEHEEQHSPPSPDVETVKSSNKSKGSNVAKSSKQKINKSNDMKSSKLKDDDNVNNEDAESDAGHDENGVDNQNCLWGTNDEELDEGNSDGYENEITAHKASLEKLKKTDPEFYKFLQDNDKKLLDFNISDSEGEDNDDEEAVHKPTGDLEIASDESDFEVDADDKEDTEDTQQRIVTLRMLKNWQVALQTDKTNKTIGCVINVFHAALLRVSNEDDEVSQYKVDGSSVFNAVIQLCVLELSPAIRRFLGLTSKMAPHKCKRFVKIKSLLRGYFTDLLKLLGGVTSANILTVLLKHLHHMLPLFVSFPNISKPMVKKLIHLWGTGDEVVRVLAFFCILRITNSQLVTLLDTVLKSMYMTYVINSKFVSVNTLSSVNFMRRSLVEMFALDPAVSYQHIFLYIRQLAIHLRNAIMVHKKENIQTVYNWQFINSLKLWGNLLAVTHDKPQLQPLVYPFVQICLGTLKLVPTAQYFPLRFHLVQILIDFSKNTGVFIPILPFILEVLNSYDFNKKHKKASMKPLSFTCLLRLSSSQMSESGFKDSLIDNVYALLLEYLASQSQSIAFPDLTLFCIFQIKQFLSKCTVANYNKKMKQILDKIHQNNEFIEKERKNVTFKLTDYGKIEAWETGVKNKGTPLNTFYESWNKMRTIKKNKEATNNDKLGDYNLPVIKRAKKDPGEKSQNKPADPFPSDSDSDDQINFGDQTEGKPDKKRGKKRRKKKSGKNDLPANKIADDDMGQHDMQDMVEDINIADW